MATNRITPFANGTQFLDWTASNCERCTKSCHQMEDIDAEPTCEIEAALIEALWETGTVTAEIAERMGYSDDDMRYVWPCREVIWCDWWKEEVTALKLDERMEQEGTDE